MLLAFGIPKFSHELWTTKRKTFLVFQTSTRIFFLPSILKLATKLRITKSKKLLALQTLVPKFGMPKEFFFLALHGSTMSYGGPREVFLSTFHGSTMNYAGLNLEHQEFFFLTFQSSRLSYELPRVSSSQLSKLWRQALEC